jgi:nucleoredoxin
VSIDLFTFPSCRHHGSVELTSSWSWLADGNDDDAVQKILDLPPSTHQRPFPILIMLPLAPIACFAFVNSRALYSSNRKMTQCLKAVSRDALASLPSLKAPDGSLIAADAISDKLQGKRVALYFAAGWCPMCTSFEPGLLQFREAAAQSGKDVEIIYVPSDRSDADAVKRTTAMGMMSVPIGEEADAIKTRFKIWAGAESSKLGTGRRSGVPSLVVLDSEKGEELKFLAAESEGVKSLSSWPLDDEIGVW